MAVKNFKDLEKTTSQGNGWKVSFVYKKDGLSFNEVILNTIRQESSWRPKNKNTENIVERRAPGNHDF